MPNHPAAALALRPGDRAELERWLRSSSVGTGLAQRARLVLLAAEGLPNHQIAVELGVSRPTVTLWRSRYAEGGLAALTDRSRPGRPHQRGNTDPERRRAKGSSTCSRAAWPGSSRRRRRVR